MTSVFSRIIAGELPARFVYDDESVTAFLSIAPLTVGHTLVVPKVEADHWQTLDPALWAHLTAVAQRVGQAVRTAFAPDRVGLVVAGFEVPHVHVHVFPTSSMGDFDFGRARPRSDAEMDDAADRLRAALGTA